MSKGFSQFYRDKGQNKGQKQGGNLVNTTLLFLLCEVPENKLSQIKYTGKNQNRKKSFTQKYVSL